MQTSQAHIHQYLMPHGHLYY